MRHLRILKLDVWYEIRTAINNQKPLFRLRQALSLFGKVLDEAKNRFVFEIRGLRLVDDLLTFYIKPRNGLELPDILKWIKQTFAVRYNLLTGRTGHIWGDRYWSLILEEEPAERAGYRKEPEAEPGAGIERVRPRSVEIAIITGFPSLPSPRRPPNQQKSASLPLFPPLYPPPVIAYRKQWFSHERAGNAPLKSSGRIFHGRGVQGGYTAVRRGAILGNR
jgi:hypothetical protein